MKYITHFNKKMKNFIVLSGGGYEMLESFIIRILNVNSKLIAS